MKVVWDEPKPLANIKAHGLDFADAKRFPWDRSLVSEVHRSRLGGRRFQVIAPLDGVLVSIIFAPLGTEGIAVISMRRSSKKESKRYEEV